MVNIYFTHSLFQQWFRGSESTVMETVGARALPSWRSGLMSCPHWKKKTHVTFLTKPSGCLFCWVLILQWLRDEMGSLATEKDGSPGPASVLLLDREQNWMPFHGAPSFLQRITMVNLGIWQTFSQRKQSQPVTPGEITDSVCCQGKSQPFKEKLVFLKIGAVSWFSRWK